MLDERRIRTWRRIIKKELKSVQFRQAEILKCETIGDERLKKIVDNDRELYSLTGALLALNVVLGEDKPAKNEEETDAEKE